MDVSVLEPFIDKGLMGLILFWLTKAYVMPALNQALQGTPLVLKQIAETQKEIAATQERILQSLDFHVNKNEKLLEEQKEIKIVLTNIAGRMLTK